jgi:integrase
MRRLSEEAIYRICARRAREAGVPPFTPHDMCRTYISTLLDRGVDLSIVSKPIGHASGPAITARYDRRDERAKHAAAETITVPYVFSDNDGEPAPC